MEEIRIIEIEPPDDLVNSISKSTGLGKKEILEILRYNVITPKAMTKITNRSISAIQNLMRPRQTPNGITTTLKKVYPHAFGSVFVLFDQNCLDYVLSTVKKYHGRTSPIFK
jgi:hypothetical protein